MTNTLARLVGINVRKRRGDISLDYLASRSPIAMSTGRVSDIESGRAAVTLPLLWAVAVALSRATMEPVSLLDLLDGDGDVSLGNQFTVELAELRAAFSDHPVPVVDAESHRKGAAMGRRLTRAMITRTPEWNSIPTQLRRNLDPGVYLETFMSLRESDDRMCKSIGVDSATGAAAMARLWGQTFSAQRDGLAGADANAQRRGRVSRQLKAQLIAEVE